MFQEIIDCISSYLEKSIKEAEAALQRAQAEFRRPRNGVYLETSVGKTAAEQEEALAAQRLRQLCERKRQWDEFCRYGTSMAVLTSEGLLIIVPESLGGINISCGEVPVRTVSHKAPVAKALRALIENGGDKLKIGARTIAVQRVFA